MKKVNLFYLKDILIKLNASHEEKTDCLWKIKKNVQKPVFCLAMKALLAEFHRISETLIQRELISAILCSHHASLLPSLKEVLKSPHSKDLDQDVLEDIEDAISTLSLSLTKPKSFAVKPLNGQQPVLKDNK